MADRPIEPGHSPTFAKRVLERAREKLAVEDRWTKGADVRDATGHRLFDVHSPKAASFSLLGAMLRTGADIYYAWWAIDKVLAGRKFTSLHAIHEFNDYPNVTHADILSVIDEAIALLTKEEKP